MSQIFFEGFTASQIKVEKETIFVQRGGSGPPLLLLHGIPETHLMWYEVAPRLAADFTVIAADLPGYGHSSKPPDTENHFPYSKRAMAQTLVSLMQQLGFDRFFVAGHDRGGRVAYRMSLDHPKIVEKLAVLDIVPTGDVLSKADLDFAMDFWVWTFLAQPYNLPEKIVGATPQVFLDYMLDGWSKPGAFFPAEVRDAYLHNFTDPATLHAICEEYRAAVTLDFQHDEADRGKKRIECPMLALWGAEGGLQKSYDVLALWRQWADNVKGRPLDCGHFLPEEASEETYKDLHSFFTAKKER